jgi:hypothetical protein
MPPKQRNGRKPKGKRSPVITRQRTPRLVRTGRTRQRLGVPQAKGYAVAGRRVRPQLAMSVRTQGGAHERAKAYASAITLPQECNPIRFPTVDSSRTSKASFMDQYTVTTNTAVWQSWPAGDLLFAFFGQPNRLSMHQVTLPSGSTSVYPLNFLNKATLSSGLTWYLPINWGSLAGATNLTTPINADWPLLGATLTTGTVALHGTTMPFGTSREKKFIWADAGTVLSIASTIPVSTGGANLYLSLYEWSDTIPAVVDEVAIPFNSGNVAGSTTYTFAASGYYAFQATNFVLVGPTASVINNLSTITMTWTNTGPLACWGTHHLGDLDAGIGGDPTMGRKIRVNASSLLLTNTTAEIQLQGTVLASRINEVPFNQVTPAILARAAEKYTGKAANGVYTYKEFTPYAERYVQVVDNTSSLFFDLDYTDYYHFIQLSSTSFSATPNTFTLSYSTMVEFQSDLSRHNKEVALASDYQHLIMARAIVASSPQWFFENPTHLSTVMGWIRRGAQGVYNGARSYGPTFLSGMSSAFPAYSPLLTSAANLLRALP